MIIKSTILPPARCTFPQNSLKTSEEFSGPKRVLFLNSCLTIIAQFLCRSRATHFSISQGFQIFTINIYLKPHFLLMNSFTVPNLPSPTLNGSSLVTNQMALKAWARVTFFLFSPFFLLYRRKKCLADEKRARMPRFSAMNSSLPIMAI